VLPQLVIITLTRLPFQTHTTRAMSE